MNSIAYIGIGSNLNDPLLQIQKIIKTLATQPHIVLIKSSRYYFSKPMGPQNQPDYVNAVVMIKTMLSPFKLLGRLKNLEIQQGRIKTTRWGPRIIDLDILLYGNQTLKTNILTIPHPGIYHRPFVIEPLKEIEPNLTLPNGKKLKHLTVENTRNLATLSESNNEILYNKS